jgi:hypothetical protein
LLYTLGRRDCKTELGRQLAFAGIHLFVLSSLDSRLGLLLRLMKVLLEYGLLGHAAGDCRLGWFWDGSDASVLLLLLLFRVGYDEKAGNHRCVAALVWLFSPAWEAVELTPLAWTAPRWRGRHHFHQAAYPLHVWSLTSCNGAFFSFTWHSAHQTLCDADQ